MRFYSDELKKFFSTEEECLQAERDYNTKLAKEKEEKAKVAEERKARAKEVEEAKTKATEAWKHYLDLVKEFTKDYGSYHTSYTSNDNNSMFKWFFDLM